MYVAVVAAAAVNYYSVCNLTLFSTRVLYVTEEDIQQNEYCGNNCTVEGLTFHYYILLLNNC